MVETPPTQPPVEDIEATQPPDERAASQLAADLGYSSLAEVPAEELVAALKYGSTDTEVVEALRAAGAATRPKPEIPGMVQQADGVMVPDKEWEDTPDKAELLDAQS